MIQFDKAHHSGMKGIQCEPLLLSTFVRTVGIIIHASAPSALDLLEMVREYWDFLLSIRRVAEDVRITEAMLFGLLVILEILSPRQVAENYPKHVVETQAWTAGSGSMVYLC
jgi:telomere length regulation protein